jgi:hypothetical protein
MLKDLDQGDILKDLDRGDMLKDLNQGDMLKDLDKGDLLKDLDQGDMLKDLDGIRLKQNSVQIVAMFCFPHIVHLCVSAITMHIRNSPTEHTNEVSVSSEPPANRQHFSMSVYCSQFQTEIYLQ